MEEERRDSDSEDVISEGELLLPEHSSGKGDVETRGVRTHFWLERTYFDKEGIEHWQTEQEINLKLWLITKIVNLKQTQEEFPAVPWLKIIQSLWVPRNLATILEALCSSPSSSAALPLRPFLGIPENLTVAGKHRGAVDPRLEIRVIPRRVEWETGKFGYITKTPAGDGTEDLKYKPTKTPVFKTTITAGKILVLIRTKREKEPETSEVEENCKQGMMGTKMTKGEGLLTPVELVIRQHPDFVKQIKNCMIKWHRRTSGKLQWPERGTFDAACCREVEANIKHYKANDTSNSREGKRARERGVLGWFRETAKQHILEAKQMPAVSETKRKVEGQQLTPTAPAELTPPPPYSSNISKAPAGQYPLLQGEQTAEGELQGKFTIYWKTQPMDEMAKNEETESQTSSRNPFHSSTCENKKQREKDRSDYAKTTKEGYTAEAWDVWLNQREMQPASGPLLDISSPKQAENTLSQSKISHPGINRTASEQGRDLLQREVERVLALAKEEAKLQKQMEELRRVNAQLSRGYRHHPPVMSPYEPQLLGSATPEEEKDEWCVDSYTQFSITENTDESAVP